MFHKRKSFGYGPEHGEYDRNEFKPVIRAGICTGEQVAGFKNLRTGKFEEVALLRDNRDLEAFCARYGIVSSEIAKEW